MTKSLFEEATDPQQYDLEGLSWEEMGSRNSPTREFFKSYLFSELHNLTTKDVLDIGSGTGWLLEEMREKGAQSITGIEPSEQNVALAKKAYPRVTTVLSSLEGFKTGEQFDIITSIMVMVHVSDVGKAMEKIADLLKQSGELHIFVPPYDYTKTPRFGYRLEIEHLNDNEYAVAVTRSNGTIVDVVRKVSVYEEAGKKVGLRLDKVIGMKLTVSLIQREPKYEQFKDVAIADYLIFKK